MIRQVGMTHHAKAQTAYDELHTNYRQSKIARDITAANLEWNTFFAAEQGPSGKQKEELKSEEDHRTEEHALEHLSALKQLETFMKVGEGGVAGSGGGGEAVGAGSNPTWSHIGIHGHRIWCLTLTPV